MIRFSDNSKIATELTWLDKGWIRPIPGLRRCYAITLAGRQAGLGI